MALTFRNSFEVPLPAAEAWAVLLDVPRVATCLPGAELTESVDARTYRGRVNVSVGPVALSFAGTAEFAEIDEAARAVRIKGAGSEAKGRGRASAEFRIRLVELSPSLSRVEIDSDVTLAGAVAQYGRGAGIMKAVADEIVARFAANLAQKIARAKQQPQPAVAPPSLSGVALLWAALKRWLKDLFGSGAA